MSNSENKKHIAMYIGSLEKGKFADMSLFDGDPLDVYSSPALVVAGGEIRYERTE